MVYLRRPEPQGPAEPKPRQAETTPEMVAFDVTVRQLECLAWAGEGKTAFEIGIILGISPRTVEGHLAKICEVFGVRKRVQAVVIARDLNALPSLRP